jgi:aryl-alcohol dehydrogenase-like predicted oxidoreductase
LAKGRVARPWGQQTARAAIDSAASWILPQNDDRLIVEAVQQIAAQRQVPMAQVATAWVLANPVVAAPIIGVTRPEHLIDAVAAVDLHLGDDEIKSLEEHYTPRVPTGF